MKTANPNIPAEWSVFQYSLWSQGIVTNVQGFQTDAEAQSTARHILQKLRWFM